MASGKNKRAVRSVTLRKARNDRDRRINHKRNLKRFRLRDDYFHSVILRDKTPDESLFITKKAPSTFSILTNRSQTIDYLTTVSGMLESHTQTRMNFKEVQETDLATICVLGAFLLDAKHRESPWEAVIPPPSAPNRLIWDEVQFDRMILKEKRQFFSSGSFVARTSTTIDTPSIEPVLNLTLDYFGADKQSEISQLSAVINEILENTTWHADPEMLSSVPWIINTRTNDGEGYKEIEYCVVDLGVGIYESIKKNVLRYNTRKAKVMHRLSAILNDGEQSEATFLAKNIPGGIGSRTNQETRGKGVRHIHQVAQDHMYSTFDIITNRARINLKNLSDVEEDTKKNFFGTVYNWKIRL